MWLLQPMRENNSSKQCAVNNCFCFTPWCKSTRRERIGGYLEENPFFWFCIIYLFIAHCLWLYKNACTVELYLSLPFFFFLMSSHYHLSKVCNMKEFIWMDGIGLYDRWIRTFYSIVCFLSFSCNWKLINLIPTSGKSVNLTPCFTN